LPVNFHNFGTQLYRLLQEICNYLAHLRWRRHTRCAGCVRTPCQENT